MAALSRNDSHTLLAHPDSHFAGAGRNKAANPSRTAHADQALRDEPAPRPEGPFRYPRPAQSRSAAGATAAPMPPPAPEKIAAPAVLAAAISP